MSIEKRYNGWKNYETWNVALWISNDQGTEMESRGMANRAWVDAEATKYSTRLEVATAELADKIKDWIEEQNPLASGASMFTDLMNAALDEVDWYEIAKNWLEDVDEDTSDVEVEA